MFRVRRTSSLPGLAFALVFGGTLAARAQEAPPVATAPNLRAGPDLPTSPPSSGTALGAADTQAPPQDPTKPEGPRSAQAVKQAKEAELTPIVSSPHDVTRPAYQLFAQTDVPLLGIGLVLASSRLFRTQPAYCAPLCNRADLNPLDRTTAGFWSVGWSTASDVGVYMLMGGAAIALIADEGLLPALNDTVVIAESGLMATALSTLLALEVGRPRPFLYGEKAPLDQRNTANGGLSFVSSHASVAFALVTSMYMTERRLHPGQALPYIVLGTGLAVASFVATARVMAGKHFITDSIGGAIMGASVGILVPALHGSPIKLVPTVAPKAGSMSVVGAF